MSTASDPSHPESHDEQIAELHRQLHRFSNAIAEFEAMGAELKARQPDARVADMIRLNRETINSMRRSAELVQERLKSLEARQVAATASNRPP
jgi:hypothetical protein